MELESYTQSEACPRQGILLEFISPEDIVSPFPSNLFLLVMGIKPQQTQKVTLKSTQPGLHKWLNIGAPRA